MYQVLIDGRPYQTCRTAEEAEAVRATMRRWSSCSTRIEVVAVAEAAAPCGACGGAGTATRLLWVGSRGGWVHGPGECRACRGTGAAGEGVAAPIAA